MDGFGRGAFAGWFPSRDTATASGCAVPAFSAEDQNPGPSEWPQQLAEWQMLSRSEAPVTIPERLTTLRLPLRNTLGS